MHFTKEDAYEVLSKVHDALENDGIFIFNAMNKDIKDIDEEWVDFSNEYHMGEERFYKYFKKEELENIIEKVGFSIFKFHYEGGNDNNKWFVYVLKKQI